MTPNGYQTLAARTINNNLSDYEKENHAKDGMVSEIGEICSIYQKRYQGHPIDYAHLKSEVGDLLWFVAEYCTANGWTLEDVMRANIEKLKKRYPNGFEVERSLNREEWDI